MLEEGKVKRNIVVLVVIAGAVMALAACGGPEAPTPYATLPGATSPAPSPTTPASEPSGGQPSEGGAAPVPSGGDPVRGEEVYINQGCIGCHTTDGSTGLGPTWRGIYGSQEELTDGTVVTVDDDYIRRSILEPGAQLVKGYTDISMTLLDPTEEEIENLIAFIKSLR